MFSSCLVAFVIVLARDVSVGGCAVSMDVAFLLVADLADRLRHVCVFLFGSESTRVGLSVLGGQAIRQGGMTRRNG